MACPGTHWTLQCRAWLKTAAITDMHQIVDDPCRPATLLMPLHRQSWIMDV